MDISSINSIYSSLLGTNATPGTNLGTNFADYFLNATATRDSKDKEKENSLFKDLSGFGTSSALQGLLSGQTKDTSAIYSFLNSSATNDSAATDTFSGYLQTNFQAQQMKMMSGAKEKLTAQMKTFEEAMGEKPNEAMKFRLEQMKQNINTIETYLTEKQAKQPLKNDLMNQLQSSSAFSQYLLTQQKSFF